MSDRLSKISDEYERLVNEDVIKWQTPDLDRLPESTRLYVELFLVPYIEFWVDDKQLGGTFLFKLNHDKVHYLHHDPHTKVHMWADEGFHNALCDAPEWI